MSVSIELLDALKAALGGVSDYRAAKLLEVSQPTMSKYRHGDLPLSAEKVLLACKLAGFSSTEWLLKLQIERARTEDEITVWNDLLNRLAA